jgi:SAM-dependent methyltransferase
MNLLEHHLRLQNFINERIQNDIYAEPPSALHTQITKEMIGKLNTLSTLNGKKILDCGCGQGVAMEDFRDAGAKPIGTTFGEDYEICKSKGFEVYEMDQSFLDFPEKTFDIVWCRHALEHSLFPLFTLRGFYEVLKPDGILYVEVPAPDTSARHETNQNHYSCFTKNAWLSLFQRSKFQIIEQIDLKFKIPVGDDLYHCFYLRK